MKAFLYFTNLTAASNPYSTTVFTVSEEVLGQRAVVPHKDCSKEHIMLYFTKVHYAFRVKQLKPHARPKYWWEPLERNEIIDRLFKQQNTA